jgi:hypothetical protein
MDLSSCRFPAVPLWTSSRLDGCAITKDHRNPFQWTRRTLAELKGMSNTPLECPRRTLRVTWLGRSACSIIHDHGMFSVASTAPRWDGMKTLVKPMPRGE